MSYSTKHLNDDSHDDLSTTFHNHIIPKEHNNRALKTQLYKHKNIVTLDIWQEIKNAHP